MRAQDVQEYIRGLSDLSTIPALAGKVIAIAADEEASAEDLHTVISFDQALAERVLKVANSVLLGHSGQIRDIKQAVLFLGFDRIKSIALGMTVMDIFPSGGSFHVENLWIHSYEVAFLASALSDSISMTRPRECFLAGLLHDVGRIIFYSLDHKKFAEIETTDTMLEQEQARFGCTHADAGAWFAESIRLPAETTLSIRHHHRPSAAPEERDLVSLIALAEALSRRFSPRVEDDGLWTPEHDAVLLEFALSQRDVDDFGERFSRMRCEIETFFSP